MNESQAGSFKILAKIVCADSAYTVPVGVVIKWLTDCKWFLVI